MFIQSSSDPEIHVEEWSNVGDRSVPKSEPKPYSWQSVSEANLKICRLDECISIECLRRRGAAVGASVCNKCVLDTERDNSFFRYPR